MRTITSLTNDTVKLVRSLEMRKARKETGLFVAEGPSVLISAYEMGHLPRILVTRQGLAPQGALARLMAAAMAAGCDVISASEPVLEKLSTKDNPQAVVGVYAQRWARLPDPVKLRPETTWIALEHVRDPGNLGTIVRTADAAGAAGIILVGTCSDPWSREAVRATMGSIFSVPIARVDDAGGEALVRGWPGDRVGTHLAGSQDFRIANYRGPTLLVMGSEGPGLTDGLAGACNRLVRIPMAGRLDSLNLAVATALTLYAIRGPFLRL